MNLPKLADNLKRMRQNLLQYRKRLESCPFPPLRFWIEPTNHCNLRCPMCPTGRRETGVRPGFMDMNLYRSVIDEISEYAVDVNLFDRGESTIHKDLPGMISYAKEKGLRVRLETNATLLNEGLARDIIERRPDFVSFSFDGYTKEVHEAVRAGSEYEKTLGNILRFLEIKKEKRKARPFTCVQIIEMKEEREKTRRADRRRFKALFRGLPLDGFRIISPHRFAGSIHESVTGSRFGYISEAWSRLVRPHYLPCPYLWFSMVVTWDGKIVPCCMDFSEKYIVGQAGRDRLLDVWNNDLMKDLRIKVASGRYKEVKMCSDCDMLWQYSAFGVSLKSLRDGWIYLREASL